MINLNLQVKASWAESILTFLNVKRKKLNPLSLDQKRRLWVPTLLFPTANDKPEILFGAKSSNGEIVLNPDAKGKTAPLTKVHNHRSFAGSEGQVFSVLIHREEKHKRKKQHFLF